MLKSDRPNQFEFESERHRVCPHQNDLEISNRFQNRNRWLPPPPHQFIKNSKVEKRRRLAIFGVELFKRSHGRSVVAKKQNKTKKNRTKQKNTDRRHPRDQDGTRPTPYLILSLIHRFIHFSSSAAVVRWRAWISVSKHWIVDWWTSLKRCELHLFCFVFGFLFFQSVPLLLVAFATDSVPTWVFIFGSNATANMK